MNLILFLTVGILGGTTGSLIKYAVLEIPPILLVTIRFGAAVVILLPFVLKKGITVPKEKRVLLSLSSLALAANVLLFATGVQYTSATMSQLIYVPTSILVAFFGYLFLKEKLSKNQLLGLLITIIGMLVLALGSIKTPDIHTFGNPLGNFLIFVGLFFWTAYIVISRKVIKDFSPLTTAFYNTVFGFIISILVIPIEMRNHDYNLSNISAAAIFAVLIAAVTSTFFIVLNQRFIKTTSAFIASLVTYIGPITAAMIGIIVFNEVLTANLIIGGLIVFTGVFLATSYNYIKGKIKKSR